MNNAICSRCRHRLAGFVVIFLTVSVSGRAEAQENRLEALLAARPTINKTLTVDEAVAIAVKESPVVRGAASQVEAAEGGVGAARAQTCPLVSVNTFASGGSNANIVASPGLIQPQMIQTLPRDAFIDQNISVMYPLYTGGRLAALIKQASALRSASEAERETQAQEITLLTRTAYWDVLARRAMADVQNARRKENAERLRLDRVRLQQEQIPAYYVQRDEAEVAAAQQEVTNATRDADLALLQLKTVMGVNPASQIEVALSGQDEKLSAEDAIAQLTAAVTPDGSKALPPLTTLLRIAARHRPELAAAARRTQGASFGATAARGMYAPQISLFGMGDVTKARGQGVGGGITCGVVASLPLYTGGQRSADIRSADAQRRRAEQDEERVALQVAQEISAALLNLRAAGKNVETATIAVTAATEESRIARLRYEAGRSIVTEALDAQTAQIRAEGNRIQARYQFKTANDQLRRAVGL